MSDHCELTYKLDGVPHTVVVETNPCLIGRSPDCTVTLIDDSVSRVHGELRCDAGQWTVRDKKSRNGVYVNYEKVSEARLRHGDRITLGRIELQISLRSASRVQLQFEDTEQVPVVSQTINVENFRDTMFSDSELVATVPTKEKSEPALMPEEDRSAQWALPLFSRAAEALLSQGRVEDMLDTILRLVFESLPAERGCAFLFDEETGERSLEVMRTKSGSADEDFVISSTIVQQCMEQGNAVLVMDSFSDDALSNQDSIVMNMIRSAMCAPLDHDKKVIGLLYVDTQRMHRQFTRQHLAALTTLALLSAAAVQQTQLRDKIAHERSIRNRLERYSAPAVVTRIIQGEVNHSMMIAEEVEASVLFLDVANFTGLAEQLSPIETTRVLNSVFGRLTDCVFDVEGTLDKFMGDGLMAIFGAPLHQEDHAKRAVTAAMKMQEQMAEFNDKTPEFPIGVRIGIASGPMLAGDIGSERRKDFTVIGDTVNIASRLESQVAKVGQVVISPITYRAVHDSFDCQELGPVNVKGKSLVLHPYRVLGAR